MTPRTDEMMELDEVLTLGDPVPLADLRARFGSKVDEDLAVLVAAGWPLERDEADNWAMVRCYFLPERALTDAEAGMFARAAGLLTDIDADVARFLWGIAQTLDTEFPEGMEMPDLSYGDLGLADHAAFEWLPQLRRAARLRLRATITYADRKGAATLRAVRPLMLDDVTGDWTLIAWCELRKDFRAFRLDRMTTLKIGTPFPVEPGRELDDYLASEAGR
jgi:predicted DNA-binding transcriptional regulator YafY